ncbi:NADH-quinone oxidoreductase subunit L [Aquipseudomonas alcaligenes]|uniref:Probable inorganic carbon transporter subunit DabB n=1 Tax=Aquipseudomonas alcaligenes TaxID=43263 RepID=A0AA37CFN4_AQUAC|nr:NADH-quinone oxidoreductase subunit L [Pseudomonas alcaligenes]BCR25278.1 NADH dehydrogenase subunit L [Pseudomonas alcaligenes]GIZ66729.1 NADH dehydrogenase subunit L [Pseudomonas alcaligenes]GIZ71587.1 NADH dehydrogenase subunit L [Pseudomonas alcaligenes]GIZ75936.1 NADH dehydrogenase subunit L [Pseudomonas alcaligenes]GIZ80363.1 NADH dehydrogenase subunit L [Pseudomonas alcaligenes]
MFSLSFPLAQGMPWLFALALLPAALLRGFWWPARIAGGLGLALVLGAWLQAALDGQDNDRLGLAMLGLVGLLAWVIIEYSRRYLEGEPGQRRYVLALLVTLAAVATVVTSTDLILLVGAWILSSLSLHQLLTFYRDRPQALVVAHKKFLASRLADACLIVAALLLIRASGDSNMALIVEAVNARLQASGQLGWDLQLAALLLALAVILKSAQLPVHGWLIQVMEAPTPVSALLHAGLVNLGGFLVLRFAPLFSAAVPAQSLLVVVGGLTAVIAALVMMTRISIKVRLAWSTCAQMGLMLLECGLGLYELALVHLLAHSLYKAHAFLAAGETVAQARQHALQPLAAVPGLAALLLALLLASLSLALLQGLWAWLLPTQALPLAALAILAVGLAPWCLRRGQVLYGLAMFALLLGAYLLWHQAAAWILQQPGSAAPWPLSALALLLFLGLYLLQALILARPQGALARRLYPLAFAGFYLDEHFTRLTFRLWPVRAPQAPSLATGDRP